MKKPLSVFLLCLLYLPAMAISDFFLGNLDVRSGMSDNFVNDIIRDQYGFMWLSTSNGLNRYDGYQFKSYAFPQSEGSNSLVVKVVEDGAGTLWVQSYDHIYVYNRLSDRIDDTAEQQLQALGIKENVSSLYTDDANNLWAVSARQL